MHQCCITHAHIDSGIDENIVSIVEGVADAVENQADAGRDATLADRLKMAGRVNCVLSLCLIYQLCGCQIKCHPKVGLWT